MERIDFFEQLIRENRRLDEAGVNPTLFWAYRNSREAGCENIDFSEVVWERDVEPIVGFCREQGLEKITISCGSSGLTALLWEFTKLGCSIEGMTEVPTRCTRYNPATKTQEPEVAPAVIIKM